MSRVRPSSQRLYVKSGVLWVARAASAVRVRVDGFGDLSFEAAEGFGAAVAAVEPALVVVASGAWADGLGVRGEGDGVVELAVAVARQPVADDVAAAGLYGRGAGVA